MSLLSFVFHLYSNELYTVTTIPDILHCILRSATCQLCNWIGFIQVCQAWKEKFIHKLILDIVDWLYPTKAIVWTETDKKK